MKINCEAENIHFLENDSFIFNTKKNALKEHIKSPVPTSIDLSSGFNSNWIN